MQQRAEAAGLDLDALKRSDPQRYKMLNAQRLLRTQAPFVERVSDVFFAAFRHYELFQLLEGEYTVLLAFPALSEKELGRLDDALGRLVALPDHAPAYYRVVNDKQGEQRELALPVLPGAWRGEGGVVVGPFAAQADAEAWGNAHVQAHALTHDAVPYAGAWYCDVFSSV